MIILNHALKFKYPPLSFTGQVQTKGLCFLSCVSAALSSRYVRCIIRTDSHVRMWNFTSWHGCLPEKISLNSVETKATRLISARYIIFNFTIHNSLISTIPWLPFLTLTQHCFSLTALFLPHICTTGLHSESLPSTVCLPTRTRPFPVPAPSDWLWLFLSQTFSHINTPTISYQLFFLLTLPMKMEETKCSKMSAHKIQMPGNHPNERIQDRECCDD